MNRTKRILAVSHWIGLFSAVVLYVILKSVSNDTDKIIVSITNIFLLVSIIWVCLLFITTLTFGNKDKLMEKMSSGYRRMLENIPVLLTFNAITLLVASYFAYIIFFYQTVEFYTEKRAEIFLNDQPGSIYQIGFIEPGKITTYRLKIGKRQLLYKFLDAPDSIALPPILVDFSWESKNTQRINLKLDHTDEKLHPLPSPR